MDNMVQEMTAADAEAQLIELGHNISLAYQNTATAAGERAAELKLSVSASRIGSSKSDLDHPWQVVETLQ